MKTKIALFMCFLLLTSFSYSETSYTFTDDTENTITLSKKPVRTAVLFSSYAQMWTLSGGSIHVTVGEAVERGFVNDDTILVDSGAGKKIDLETLIMAEPDFIIGSKDIPFHEKARRQMNQTGIPFALFHVESIDDYLRVFKIMTSINQAPDRFEKYGENVFKEAQEIIEFVNKYADANPQEILFIRSGSGYSSAKAKTKEMHFAAKMLYDLGAENIADDIPVIIDGLSFEEIYMKDPDAIFISLMGEEDAAKAYMSALFCKPDWQMLNAVQKDRCYYLSKDLFQFKPNERWAEAYRKMAEMLYPELMEAWEKD